MATLLDGDPAPIPPIGQSPQFSARICYRKMAGWIKMSLSREVGLGPSDIVLHGDPAPPPQKGVQPPDFRPMSIVAKLSPISSQLLLSTCYDTDISVTIGTLALVTFGTAKRSLIGLRYSPNNIITTAGMVHYTVKIRRQSSVTKPICH